jgi:hypothetical protein
VQRQEMHRHNPGNRQEGERAPPNPQKALTPIPLVFKIFEVEHAE